MSGEYRLYEIVITAIVVKDGKYLITRRAMTKKRFPGMWTVPGGHLDPEDYENTPKESKDYWYNVLEKALARELLEEVGIKVKNVEYITSLATIHGDGPNSLVISCIADYVSGKVTLHDGENDQYAWVSLKESKKYPLIGGIYEELYVAEQKRKGKKVKWKPIEQVVKKKNAGKKNQHKKRQGR